LKHIVLKYRVVPVMGPTPSKSPSERYAPAACAIDGQHIGRIRYASERTPAIWIWHVQAAWIAFKNKHGADRLAKAYAEVNKRL
jgi:hypothetical protein